MNLSINRNKYRKTALVLVTMLWGASLSVAVTPQHTMDSLRQVMAHQKGEKKLNTMEEIYNQSLLVGDFKLQLRCLDEWQAERYMTPSSTFRTT